MVEVESVILTEISNKYMNLFAENDRKFIRANESQQNWVDAVVKKYSEDMTSERLHLFSIINERFHKTAFYLRLKKRLTYNVVKPNNSLLPN